MNLTSYVPVNDNSLPEIVTFTDGSEAYMSEPERRMYLVIGLAHWFDILGNIFEARAAEEHQLDMDPTLSRAVALVFGTEA